MKGRSASRRNQTPSGSPGLFESGEGAGSKQNDGKINGRSSFRTATIQFVRLLKKKISKLNVTLSLTCRSLAFRAAAGSALAV